MISHKHQCIFVHIPRCGGTSLEDVIWPGPRDEASLWMGFISKYQNKYQTGGLQHLFATHIRREVGDDVFKRYFKFSVIRNPWDRTVSQFSYMSGRSDLREYIGMKESASLKDYLGLIGRRVHVQWEQQHKFVMDEHGELMVDFLGRFEHFKRDAAEILHRLNIMAEVPHTNAAPHRPFSEYYDREAIEMVADLYRDVIRLFDYSFS